MQEDNQSLGQKQLLKKITKLLAESHIGYMVTGALSVIFYGRPRASHDIDFVIEAKKDDISKVIKAFANLPSEFLVQNDQIEEAIKLSLSFNILHLPTMLKLDFFILRNETFDKSRFSRRKKLKIFGKFMTFASAEDTILIKLLWYKDSRIEKHLIDAAFVYQIQEKNLDKSYLLKWAKKHKTGKLLEEVGSINLEPYY